MSDWGIRISQPGKSVLTGTDPEMVFSSKFAVPKVHSNGSGSIYNSTGRTITIAHNLGYVPQFIVHTTPDPFLNSTYSGKFSIAPYSSISGSVPSWYFDKYVTSYADSTNLYIKLGSQFGYHFCTTGAEHDNYGLVNGSYLSGFVGVGKTSSGSYIYNGALRFNSVTASGSVYKAEIGIHINDGGSQSTPVKTVGIDEDNVGGFGSSPFGKSQTTANVQNTRDGGLGDDSTWVYEVTSIFNEILDRSGWSSGNHMGFLMFDNGSSVNNTAFATEHSYDTDGAGFPLTYLKWLTTDKLADYKYTIFKNKIA